MTYALLITIPLVFVWLVVLFDVAMRRDLSPQGRVGWIAAVTLLWPTMILYLLLRPVQGRLVSGAAVRRQNPDQRQRLVAAVLDRQAGMLTQQQFEEVVDHLRGRPS